MGWELTDKMQPASASKVVRKEEEKESIEAPETAASSTIITPLKVKKKIINKLEKRAEEVAQDLEERRQVAFTFALAQLVKFKKVCEVEPVTTDNLVGLYTAAQEADIALINCNDSSLINQHHREITQALNDSKQKGIKRLSRAVIIDDQTEMSKLQEFAKFLPENQITLAIAGNKLERLEWLLCSGSFPLNQMRVDIDGKRLSLLEFSFIKNKPECFRILLAHGASPLLAEEGLLPVAHQVLRTKPAPFYNYLLEHIRENSPKAFFKQLIVLLSKQLAGNELDSDGKMSLKQAIIEYKNLSLSPAEFKLAIKQLTASKELTPDKQKVSSAELKEKIETMMLEARMESNIFAMSLRQNAFADLAALLRFAGEEDTPDSASTPALMNFGIFNSVTLSNEAGLKTVIFNGPK